MPIALDAVPLLGDLAVGNSKHVRMMCPQRPMRIGWLSQIAVGWAATLALMAVPFVGVVPVAAGSVVFVGVADETSGKRTLETHCAEWPAAGFAHPGTQRLGWRRGERYAALTQRTDLSAHYVRLVVRRGVEEMPPFRPSEISDAELAKLGAYLAKSPEGRPQPR
jgi:hypothetical protein